AMNASMVVSTRMRTVHPRPDAAEVRSRAGSSAMGRIVGDGGGADHRAPLDSGGVRAYICPRTDKSGISGVHTECAPYRGTRGEQSWGSRETGPSAIEPR